MCPYSDGIVVRCDSTGATYKIENGQARWYPNMAAYRYGGSPAWSYNDVCNMPDECPRGPDMPGSDSGNWIETGFDWIGNALGNLFG